MRQFKKSDKLDNVLYDVRGPVVDEAARMEEDGARILKLNIGNPATFGFRAPDEVVFDMRQQLADCEGYSDSRGLFAARKAIMQYSQLRNIPNVDMRHIYTGNGVSELIQLCMHALLDDGDEVLIPISTLKQDEDIFLDDMTLQALQDALGVPVTPVRNTGEALLAALLGPKA